MKEVMDLLTIPGNGVYTVHTAKDKKDKLHQTIFNTTEQNTIIKKWKTDFLTKIESKKPLLLGICSDTGGGILRGANWGPLFIRENLYSNTLANKFEDIGDIRVIPHLLHDKYLNEETIKSCRIALYNDENSELPVSPLSMTSRFLSKLYKYNTNKKVIGLGGDHSVSYPLVKEWAKNMKSQNERAALIHFDAHTDLLDQRLGIDLCFGSWTYHILDYLYDHTDLYQIGIRASGKDRSHWEKQFNINQIWANEVKTKGAANIAEDIIKDLKSKNIKKIYISYDIDAIDSKYASATGTPESDGLEPYQSMTILNLLLNEFELTGSDIVEVAPFIQYPELENNAKTTVEIAGDIVAVFLNNYSKYV